MINLSVSDCKISKFTLNCPYVALCFQAFFGFYSNTEFIRKPFLITNASAWLYFQPAFL